MNFTLRRRSGNGAVEQSRERLMSEFRATIADTEDLLRSVADASGERVEVARERMRNRLREARSALNQGEIAVQERFLRARRASETYVADNPWRSMATAMAVGATIAYLLRSRH